MTQKTAISVVVAVLVVAGAAYAGASDYLGQRVEARYNEQLDKQIATLEATAPTLKTTRSYDRGWFGSNATVTMTYTPPVTPQEADPDAHAPAAPVAPGKSISVTIDNHIQHGPIAGWKPAAASIESSLGPVEGLTEKQRAAFARAEAPHMRTVFGFDGAFNGRLVLPPGEVVEDANRAQWQQLDYTFASTSDSHRFEGDVSWPQMTIDMVPNAAGGKPRPVHIRIEGLAVKYTTDVSKDAALTVSAGSGTGTIDKLSFTDADSKTPVFELDGVKIASRTHLDGQLVGTDQTMSGTGTVVGQPIEAFEYKLAIARLDAAAMQSLQKALAPARQADGAGQPTEAQQAVISRSLVKMLASSPTLGSSFKATIGGETGSFTLEAALPAGASPIPAVPSPAFLMMSMAQQLQGTATAQLPKAWIPMFAGATADAASANQAVNGALGRFAASGILIDDGKVWRSELKYAQGVPTLNGKPLQGLGLGGPATALTAPARGDQRRGAPR